MKPARLLTLVGSLLSLSGCFTAQNPSTLEAIDAAAGAKGQPFVEAYFEFGGPAAKWAGPESSVVRVLARDASGKAQVSVTPDPRGMNVVGRAPAEARAGVWTAEYARAQFAEMAAIMENDPTYSGPCMFPVRVRLVRQDGSVFEKSGCRSQQGWPGLVSRTVSQLVSGV